MRYALFMMIADQLDVLKIEAQFLENKSVPKMCFQELFVTVYLDFVAPRNYLQFRKVFLEQFYVFIALPKKFPRAYFGKFNYKFVQ